MYLQANHLLAVTENNTFDGNVKTWDTLKSGVAKQQNIYNEMMHVKRKTSIRKDDDGNWRR